MRIEQLSLQPYRILLKTGIIRLGFLIRLIDQEGRVGWGEVAPLPGRSRETLEQTFYQFNATKEKMQELDWNCNNYLTQLQSFSFLPSLSFGWESAIAFLLFPLPSYSLPIISLLMGSYEEILQRMKGIDPGIRVKLKVEKLNFEETSSLIHHLKGRVTLHLDLNRSWDYSHSLKFFSSFSSENFLYVEEPSRDPHQWHWFPHPVAVDESFPSLLSLTQLEQLPRLKAFIYKPTLHGGWLRALPLYKWAIERDIEFILSSSFETPVGLSQIAFLAYRLAQFHHRNPFPLGVGTYRYLPETVSCNSFFQPHSATVEIHPHRLVQTTSFPISSDHSSDSSGEDWSN